MLIRSNLKGPVSLPDRGTQGTTIAKTLIPGLNDVKDELWDQWKKNPQVERLIAEGKFEVESEKSPDAASAEKAGEAQELHGIHAKKAVKLVAETLDIELLKKWKAQDARPSVQSAIQDQIAVIMEPQKAAEKKEA